MQGHIRKRGKDSWGIVIDLGRGPDGRRRQLTRSVKGRKREAEALLAQLLHQQEIGFDAPPGRVTVGEFLDRWLSTHAQPNTAPKTYRRYEQLIRVHLRPALGHIPLAKLRPLQVQDAYNEIQAKGLSPRTVLHCHRVLREALQHGVKWGLLARNAADAAEAPRALKFEVKVLRPEEVRRLQESADRTPLGALVRLAVSTGLRQGELLGLRWQDVALDAGVLSVRQTCHWLPRVGFEFREPKSHRSARAVALPKSAVATLRRHRTVQIEARLAAGPAYDAADLVFANPVGRPIHPSTLRRLWLSIVESAGTGHVRFHDLRHAHATLLLQQGVHAKVVSERLGHSTVGITLDTYSHVTPNLQAEAAAKFDEVLANG